MLLDGTRNPMAQQIDPMDEENLKRLQDVAHDPTYRPAARHQAKIISELTRTHVKIQGQLDAMEDRLVAAGVPRDKFNSPRGKAALAAKKKANKSRRSKG